MEKQPLPRYILTSSCLNSVYQFTPRKLLFVASSRLKVKKEEKKKLIKFEQCLLCRPFDVMALFEPSAGFCRLTPTWPIILLPAGPRPECVTVGFVHIGIKLQLCFLPETYSSGSANLPEQNETFSCCPTATAEQHP